MSKKIFRAGLLLYYVTPDQEIEMLFMKPSNADFGGPNFQCPKGKIDPGESPKETAIREAQEEVGLKLANLDGEIHELGRFLGRTDFFIAKVKNQNMFGQPHFETKEVRWMTSEEFQKIGRPLHKPVVKAAERKIKILENLNNERE